MRSRPRPDRRAAYSPSRRTALVLTGTGAHGAYHAGVLRALQEAGVKIDVIAGQGRWRRGRGAGGDRRRGAAMGRRWHLAFARRAEPVHVAQAPPGGGVDRDWSCPQSCCCPCLRAARRSARLSRRDSCSRCCRSSRAIPRRGLRCMAAGRICRREPSNVSPPLRCHCPAGDRGRARNRWRAVRPHHRVTPVRASLVVAHRRGAVRRATLRASDSPKPIWESIRGAAPLARPTSAALGRRYAEVLSENLGQPGFRELVLVATDLDARRDVVAALLAEPHRQTFLAPRPGRDRRSEVLDLAGVSREHAIDVVGAGSHAGDAVRSAPHDVCSRQLLARGDSPALRSRPGL